MSNSAAGIFRRVNDTVYWTGAVIGCVALVLVSAVIPWAVYTRYVLNSAASWPEPMAVLLTVVLTFFGAAACYRLGIHMNVTVGVALLPPKGRRAADLLVEILMLIFAAFMVIYGYQLCVATWNNSI